MNVNDPLISCEHFENATLVEAVDSIVLRAALGLIESGVVQIQSLQADGCIQGWILAGPNRQACQARFLPNGHLALPLLQGEDKLAASLALALCLLWQIRFSRKQGDLKNLLRSGPDWLNADYRLCILVPSWSKASSDKSLPEGLKSLEDLQAYWELLSMARSARQTIPPETLVRHVLGLYGQASWAIKRAAMETVLKRIDSSIKEELMLHTKPDTKLVWGKYSIRRKKGAQRPYEVLIVGNQGVAASCSCKDFQKNELGFCKHIATVLLHWHKTEANLKKFEKAKPWTGHRLKWTVALGLDRVVDPLENLTLCRDMADKTDLRGWKTWFDSKTFQLVLPQELEARQKSLKKLHESLQQDEDQAIVVDTVILPLVKKALVDLHWPVSYPKKIEAFQHTMESMHYKLYPYQQEGVMTALSRGKFLLGDDMGLGKTVQAITWAECLLRAREARVVLVICPAGLKTQWQREWGQAAGRECQVVVGSPADRQSCYDRARGAKQPVVLILNYELVCRDLESLRALAPEAVILDEAQRIKNYATQTALMVKALQPTFRLILTGTPMENRLTELSSLMDWIDDHAMGPQWRLDAETRISGDGDGHGPQGVKGLRLIRERLAPHFLRRLRAKVLGDLPSRTDSVLVVPITETQQDIHTDLGLKVARLMAIAAKRPLSPSEHLMLMNLLTRMRIVSNAMAQFEYEQVWESLKNDHQPEWRIPKLESPKLQTFRDLMGGLLSQEGLKIVVFSQWQRMLRLAHWAIQDVLDNSEAEAVFFTGKENARRRTENIVRFHDDPAVRVFFATDAGGVGLNLQKAATICINLELPWNPAVLEQRIGRLHRLGQKQPVQVFNLVTENSIEERISTLVGQKRAVFNELFDGVGDEVIYDKAASFYEQVRSVVEALPTRVDYGTPEQDVDGSELEASELEELAGELDAAEFSDEIEPVEAEPSADSVLPALPVAENASSSMELMAPETGDKESESSYAQKSSVDNIGTLGGEVSSMESGSNEASKAIPSEGTYEPSGEVRHSNFDDQTTATPRPPLSAENLSKAFREVKIEKTSQGTLRIEASGESAKLLAGLFRGMAEMFESVG